jgi:hypothetical protein
VNTENMVVSRLLVHEIFQRRDDKSIVSPRYGGHLITLDAAAMDVFRKRVVDAMGNASKSMEMAIIDAGDGSALKGADEVLGVSDADFVTVSQRFPDKLTSVQARRDLPGGILVVFQGTVGPQSHPFVGLIKAETHSGFQREVKTTGIDVTFLQNLFLTPEAKLYKIGMFVRTKAGAKLPTGWLAHVYDSHMTTANREGAAVYFYELFLGCAFPADAAFMTKAFFEHTRQFIRELDVTPEKRGDLLTGLFTYLKVDNAPTIELNTFAETYLPKAARDNYRDYMTANKLPLTAIPKDIAEIEGKLKMRKLVFSRNIRLTAPPEAFKDMIDIETIEGTGRGKERPQWTRITIRDQIRDQE